MQVSREVDKRANALALSLRHTIEALDALWDAAEGHKGNIDPRPGRSGTFEELLYDVRGWSFLLDTVQSALEGMYTTPILHAELLEAGLADDNSEQIVHAAKAAVC